MGRGLDRCGKRKMTTSIFIGRFSSVQEFNDVFIERPLSECYDFETEQRTKPSTILGEMFGFDCFDDDLLDCFYGEAKPPKDFYENLFQSLPESKRKYWNKSIVKQAFEYCDLNEIKEVNAVLYIGLLKPHKIKRSKYKRIDQNWSIMYCGSYDEETKKYSINRNE